MATLTVALQNRTTSHKVYAYITGQAIDSGNALFLLQADARSPYIPKSPGAPGGNLERNCAIPLGAPGNTVHATIPHIAGGRIWFSIDAELKFHINPGPALVEPAVTNPSDPNIHVHWAFAEFTWNAAQMFANISYVDFVSLPVALSLSSKGHNNVQRVVGMPPNGLDLVAQGLEEQHKADGAGWDKLVVKGPDGRILRALSPNNGMTMEGGMFGHYFAPYVDAVYDRYAKQSLAVDTQAQWGHVQSKPDGAGALELGGHKFSKPSSRDIFSCSTGVFEPSSSIEKGAMIARLAAAFNRSTLLHENVTPSVHQDKYYKERITNHYSRIVHSANVDGRGYAFPFDDVTPTGGQDQSGAVQDGNPNILTVAVGGEGVSDAQLKIQG